MAEANVDIIVNAVDNASGVFKNLGNTMMSIAGAAWEIGDAFNIADMPDWVSRLMSRDADGKLDDISKAALKSWNAMGAVLQMEMKIVQQIVEWGIEGAGVNRQLAISDQLIGSLGGNSQAFYSAVVDGARGTVNEFQIMETTNKAILAGLFKDTEQAYEFSAAIKTLSDAYGEDYQQMYESAVIGTSRGTGFWLSRLGISVPDKKVMEDYYKSINNINGELTLWQQKQAIMEYVINRSLPSMDALNNRTLTTADLWEQAGAGISEGWTRFKMGIDQLSTGPMITNIALLGGAIKLFGLEFDNISKKGANLSTFGNTILGIMKGSESALEVLTKLQDRIRELQGGEESDITRGASPEELASIMEANEALRETYAPDSIRDAWIQGEKDAIAVAKEKIAQDEFQIATFQKLAEAKAEFEKTWADAMRESRKKDREAGVNQAWEEWNDNINEATFSLMEMAGVSYEVMTEVAFKMGEVDQNAILMVAAFREIQNMPLGFETKANIIFNIVEAFKEGGDIDAGELREIIQQKIWDATHETILVGGETWEVPIVFSGEGVSSFDIASNVTWIPDIESMIATKSAAESTFTDITRYVKYIPLTINSINKQHGGDVLSGEAYTVGETGPELFIPNTRGQIIPHTEIGKISDRNQAYNFYNKVTFVVSGGEVDMAKLMKQMRV